MNKGFCTIETSRLIKAPWNYKENNAELATKLENNIRRNGQIENIIVRELDGGRFEVVNGNHRLDVMLRLGMGEVYSYNLGKISTSQAKRIAVETNETRFDSKPDQVTAILQELTADFSVDDLLQTMPFEPSDFEMRLDGLDITLEELPEEQEYEPTPEPRIQLGDIIQLGRHRLMCGDSTREENIAALFGSESASLILTDPPYGVDYGKKNKMLNEYTLRSSGKQGTRIEKDIENDDIGDYYQFFVDAFRHVPLTEYNAAYIFSSSKIIVDLVAALDNLGFYFSSYLLWLKNNIVFGRMDYSYKTELIYYGWRGKHKFYGKPGVSNVLEFDKPSSSRLHPTMKPLPLVSELMINSSKPGDIVFDGFCGSGTTLVAAEGCERTCYAVELDPAYCDIIVRRWLDFCGKESEIKLNGKNISPKELLGG